MTVEKLTVLPAGSNFVTYTPPNPFAGCNGFTSGYWELLPADPLTYTLPCASRRGGLMELAALTVGSELPTKVDQTSAVPAGLIFARKPRFKQNVLGGQGVVLYAPAVTGKS